MLLKTQTLVIALLYNQTQSIYLLMTSSTGWSTLAGPASENSGGLS